MSKSAVSGVHGLLGRNRGDGETRCTPTVWDQDDLITRLCIAIATSGRTVALLSARARRSADQDMGVTHTAILDKVVAETAMLLHAAAPLRHVAPELGTAIADVASAILPHARADMVWASMCREPDCAVENAAAHILLSDIGYVDPVFDGFLQRCIDDGKHMGPERLPHRMLERYWLLRAQRSGMALDDRVLIEQSALGRPLGILAGTRDDYYAFTHAVRCSPRACKAPTTISWPNCCCRIRCSTSHGLPPLLSPSDASCR